MRNSVVCFVLIAVGYHSYRVMCVSSLHSMPWGGILELTNNEEHTMTTTIRDLARDYHSQPYEIAAALGLNGFGETDDICDEDETFYRDALTWSAQYTQDRNNN